MAVVVFKANDECQAEQSGLRERSITEEIGKV